MKMKTYQDLVHEALADCADAGYPQHSISETICGLAKERDDALAELDAIKKQRPAETAYAMPGASGFTIAVFWSEKVPAGSPVYAKPVYQHSFTVDGHTFYADNEVDILYLERKFGVGGKAKLTVVDEEHF